MRSRLWLALLVVVLLTQSGCVTVLDIRRFRLPPPPSEDVRSQLGRVRLSEGASQTTVLFTEAAKGAAEGAARGAGLGTVYTVGGGTVGGGPYGFLVGIALAPVGALVGSVVGASRAGSAAEVEEKERAVRTAMEELKVPETFSGCVADTLRERTGGGSSGEPASTILEVVVEQFGLVGPWLINPPLTFVLTERTRLIRAFDGTELYRHWLTYRGRPRPLDDWVGRSAKTLQEESERACRELAERLVDEVFLLYLPDDERRRAR